MRTTFDVALYGADRQAATSAALARPDLRFLFVTDAPIVDGWNLPNVVIRREPGGERGLARREIALCPRWLEPAPERWRLSRVMPALFDLFPDDVLPVTTDPPAGPWVVKGDRRHRPDARIEGAGARPETLEDPHRCGVVFQEKRISEATLLVSGRCDGEDTCALGVLQLHQEALAREDFLIAAESIEDAPLAETARAMLRLLGLRGHFTFTFMREAQTDRALLTSLRPVPRALFQLFQAGGIDLLEPARAPSTLCPGLRMAVEYHYSSYGP